MSRSPYGQHQSSIPSRAVSRNGRPYKRLRDANPGRAIFATRAAEDPLGLTARLRRELEAIDGNVPVFNVRTAAEQLDESLSQERLIALLSSFFGLVALFLVCIGVFRVLSYETERRSHEIGLRVALSAQRGAIVWSVIREALSLVVLGVAIAVPVAPVTTPLLSSLLYGLTPTDLLNLARAVGSIAVVAAAAANLPAGRASPVDPSLLLRRE